MALRFQWDPAKARLNVTKHGVTFEEAYSAFEDFSSISIPDPLHSYGEERFILIGYSNGNRLFVVVHTESDANIRLISARLATKRERLIYEEG